MKYKEIDYSKLKTSEAILLEDLGKYNIITKDKDVNCITFDDIDSAEKYLKENDFSRVYQGCLKASVRLGGVLLFQYIPITDTFELCKAFPSFITKKSFDEFFKGQYIMN